MDIAQRPASDRLGGKKAKATAAGQPPRPRKQKLWLSTTKAPSYSQSHSGGTKLFSFAKTIETPCLSVEAPCLVLGPMP